MAVKLSMIGNTATSVLELVRLGVSCKAELTNYFKHDIHYKRFKIS